MFTILFAASEACCGVIIAAKRARRQTKTPAPAPLAASRAYRKGVPMNDEFARIAKFGFGCMRLPLTDPKDQTSIDMPQFEQMVDAFLEAGGTYFDTAFLYHDGVSETALNKALVQRHPRESYVLATKNPASAFKTPEEAKACLDTSLERLGVGYIDFYLLHNLGAERTQKFEDFGMWDFLLQKKAEGAIRHIGFSLHDGPEVLEQLLSAHPQVDFVQLQVNYLDWDDPLTQSRALMEVAAHHDKPVVIMEPARGGRLAELSEDAAAPLRALDAQASLASWAYRFCWNLPNVLTVLSGASTLEQMRQNAQAFHENRPLSDAERAALDAVVEKLRAVSSIPCTNCGYCLKGCPQQVAIPVIMMLLNLEAMTGNAAFSKHNYQWQATPAKASACIECGACERVCPQGIAIVEHLREAAEKYE